MSEVPRLIPDINVLLSGLSSTKGPSFDLYRAAQRFEVMLVLSEQHFTELRQVLTYPAVLALGGGITPSDAFGLAVELYRVAEVVVHLEHYDWPSCPDSKDWYLLDLLMTSDADGIVSKDKHLLRLSNKLGIPVFEPRELVKLGII